MGPGGDAASRYTLSFDVYCMKPEHTRIVFFGTPDISVPVLSALVKKKYAVVGVVTQPSKPAGRSRVLLSSPVREAAEIHGLAVSAPVALSHDFLRAFKRLRPDLAVVAAYGLIIPRKFLDVPRFGFVNIHPSLLPKYRGASPIQAVLLSGDKETGVTVMKMDEKMDHGPLLAQKKTKLSGAETYEELGTRLFDLGAELLTEILPRYLSGEIVPLEQDHAKATVTRLIKKQDGKIDWRFPAERIERMVRAYMPWPGAYTFWQGARLMILKSSVFDRNEKNNTPGKVMQKHGTVVVACGCGQLAVERVKLAGNKEMPIKDFVRGHKSFLGAVLK